MRGLDQLDGVEELEQLDILGGLEQPDIWGKLWQLGREFAWELEQLWAEGEVEQGVDG